MTSLGITPVFDASDVCYNFGAAYDILNPLIHTNCKTLVCIDIKDNGLYNKRVKSHLKCVVERLMLHIGQLNRAAQGQGQAPDLFKNMSIIEFGKSRFTVAVDYKNIRRRIIYYVGDGNQITPPEIADSVRDGTLDTIWWSMSHLEKATVDRLRPKHIIVHHTRIENQLTDYIKQYDILSLRICPYRKQLRLLNMALDVFSANS